VTAILAIVFIFVENLFLIPRAAWPFITRNMFKKGVIVAIRDDLGQIEFKRMKVDPNQGTLHGNPTEYLFMPLPVNIDEVDEDKGVSEELVKALNTVVQKRTIIKDLNVPFLIADKGSGVAVNPEIMNAMDLALEDENLEEGKKRLKLNNPNIIQWFLTMSITPDRISSWGKRFERRGKFKVLPVGKIAISAVTVIMIIIMILVFAQSGVIDQLGASFKSIFPGG
jgi:hypothetical protein